MLCLVFKYLLLLGVEKDLVLEQVSWLVLRVNLQRKACFLGSDAWLHLGGAVPHRNGYAKDKHNRKSVGRSRGCKGLRPVLGLCPTLVMLCNTAGGKRQLSSLRSIHRPLAKLGEGLIPCWSTEHGNVILKRYPCMLGSTIQKPPSENGDKCDMMPLFSLLNMSCKMNRCAV